MVESIRNRSNFPLVVVVGTVCTALSMIILPFLYSMGYLFAMMKARMQQRDEFPKLGDVGEHLMNGFFTFLVLIPYYLPVALLSIVTWAPQMLGVSNTFFAGMVSNFLWLATSITAFTASVIAPLALARFASQSRLAAAFEIPKIIGEVLGNFPSYAQIGLAAVVATGGTALVAGLLGRFLPMMLVNVIVSAAAFFATMVLAEWTGEIYRSLQPEAPAAPVRKIPPALSVEPESAVLPKGGGDQEWH